MAAAFAAFMVACGGGQSTYPNVGPGISDRHADAIFGLAEFELNCPRQQIQLSKVAQYRVGANGCGNRALYMYVQNVGWVSNSSSTQ